MASPHTPMLCLLLLLLMQSGSAANGRTWSQTGPRLQLSHTGRTSSLCLHRGWSLMLSLQLVCCSCRCGLLRRTNSHNSTCQALVSELLLNQLWFGPIRVHSGSDVSSVYVFNAHIYFTNSQQSSAARCVFDWRECVFRVCQCVFRVCVSVGSALSLSGP